MLLLGLSLLRINLPFIPFQSGATSDQSILSTGSNSVRFYCRNAAPEYVGRGSPSTGCCRWDPASLDQLPLRARGQRKGP